MSKLALTDVYRELVEWLRSEGRSGYEIRDWMRTEHDRPEISLGAINQHLHIMRRCGLLYTTHSKMEVGVAAAGLPHAIGKPKVARINLYHPTAICYAPERMAQAFGTTKANRVLEALGQPPIEHVALAETTSIRAQAVAASTLSPVQRHQSQRTIANPHQLQLIQDDEPDVLEPGRPQQLPDLLFGAQFTRRGVLITYEQFYRVVGLLQHATEGAV